MPPPSAQSLRSFHIRTFLRPPPIRHLSSPPLRLDRGPASKEKTQTDFGALNVLGNSTPPATAIDACLRDEFHLGNGLKITGGGCLLLGGEAFSWQPWLAGGARRMLNAHGQWHVDRDAWALLDLVWPKPGLAHLPSRCSRKKRTEKLMGRTDLLILGLGPATYPLAPETRSDINRLGVRVDVQDTRNAAAQFNLLATERGVGSVAAALIPVGWREGGR